MHCDFAFSLGFPDRDSPQFLHTLNTRDPVTQLAYGAKLGFVAADDPYFLLRDLAEQRAIADAARDLGLALTNITLSPAHVLDPIWGDASGPARERQGAMLREAIAGAQHVGARAITLVTGLDRARDRAEQLDAMAANLIVLRSIIDDGGVLLCLEPTSDSRVPNMLLNSLDAAQTVIAAVDSAQVRLLFDTAPIGIDHGDPIAAALATRDIIGAVQIADVPGRLDPGSGTIDFAALIVQLRADGYRGPIALEHTNSVAGAAGEALALERLRAIDAAVARVETTLPPPPDRQ
jgi:hydroxypyruvate isomerase